MVGGFGEVRRGEGMGMGVGGESGVKRGDFRVLLSVIIVGVLMRIESRSLLRRRRFLLISPHFRRLRRSRKSGKGNSR